MQAVRFLEYHKWYLDSAHFHWARTFLQPAQTVQHRAEHAALEIETLFGVKYFYAMHYRQGDFVGACAQWQNQHAIDGLKCLISADDALRMLRDIFQVPATKASPCPLHAHLCADQSEEHADTSDIVPARHVIIKRCQSLMDIAQTDVAPSTQVPAQTVLLIVPPHQLEGLGQLCTHYRCTHRELLPGFNEATEGLPPMVLAQHQFALAVLAARAFGNIYSSWSIEMLAYMRSAGKPADIINPTMC